MKIVDTNLPPPGPKKPWWFRLLMLGSFYETMSGNGACPVYLERWTLSDRFGYGVYLHHFIGDDWAADPHDHPRRFISIGLWGWYWEDVYLAVHHLGSGPDTKLMRRVKFKAPWCRSFSAHHLHRVRASECGNCWTLVIVLRKERKWGFVQEGKWIAFKDYVFGGKARKSC